MRAFVHEAPLL